MKKILFLGLGFELELVMSHTLETFPNNLDLIAFTRRNISKINLLTKKYAVKGYSDNILALESFEPDIIFIGVKPQDLSQVIKDLQKSTYKDFSHLIFITASLPFETIQETFNGKDITNIIPDDHISTEDPSNIINFCSNTETDDLIRKLFTPTCKKLVKVEPREMIEFTALACQGNPILNLLVQSYEKTEKKEPLPDYISSAFADLAKSLREENPNTFTDDLAKGYKSVIKELEIDSTLALEILQLAFESMVSKKEYYSNGALALQATITDWATEGGYEERGIEIVNNTAKNRIEDIDHKGLAHELVQQMIIRGNNIQQTILNTLNTND